MLHEFSAYCPRCNKHLVLTGDDSAGPFREAWGECDNCGAEVTQPVTWRYEFETNGPSTVRGE